MKNQSVQNAAPRSIPTKRLSCGSAGVQTPPRPSAQPSAVHDNQNPDTGTVRDSDPISDYGVFEGMATITVVNDIEALQSAIRKLAKKSENSLSDALGYGAFRRASLLPEILADLGLQPEDWCCIHDVGFPPITAIGE